MSKFLNFNSYVSGYGKGGAKAGTHDIAVTDLDMARVYSDDQMSKHGKVLSNEIPGFDIHYIEAKAHVKQGFTKRSDMPVFDTEDIKMLQYKLSKGKIDIKAPFAQGTDPDDLFPKGLTGEAAADFLERGLKDNVKTDDIIKVEVKFKKLEDLIPIQAQIYLDKCIPRIAKEGVSNRIKWIKSTLFIISSDHYIIDGHHRYMTGMIIDPDMKVECIVIDLPIRKLLDLTTAFSDAIGKKRNE